MVKFLKVRVMKTIAPSSHPHVRSPRRRPPAGFRSARPRAAPRLFFVATRVAARGRAAPADDERTLASAYDERTHAAEDDDRTHDAYDKQRTRAADFD